MLAAPRSLAVTGAKGGVGRSMLALNLALAAGCKGRVLLLDATFGRGDLATLAGVAAPEPIQTEAPAVVAIGSGVDLAVLPARFPHATNLPSVSWEAQYDWIVADTGTGVDGHALAAARAADDVLLVVAPELPAVADGYATLKALRTLRPDLCAGCVVNMADSSQEAAEVQAGLQDMAMAFLGAQIDNQGYIPFNRDVRVASKGQTPFVLAFPSSPAAVAIARIATRFIERPSPVRPPAEGAFVEETLRFLAEHASQDRRKPLQEVWASS